MASCASGYNASVHWTSAGLTSHVWVISCGVLPVTRMSERTTPEGPSARREQVVHSKSSHGVNAGGGGLSGPDVDDGSIHVYQIDLRANANATEYPTERPLDCGWPDLRRHLVHVDADE